MSERIALKNLRVVLPNEVRENVSLIIESGKIVGTVPAGSDTGTENNYDLRGQIAFPGFIDVHVHGAGGGSFTSADPAQHMAAREFHLCKGTTSLYATTVTADLDSLKSAFSALSESSVVDSGSRVLGIHAEGPFISAKKPGAHQISLLRNGSISEFQELVKASNNLIKRITLAPEIAGGRDLLTFLLKEGIQVSTGHSHATYEEALAAFRAGSQSVTHMFNAMSGFNHREPGLIGAILDSSEVYTEVILDEVHVHPAAFRILLKSRPVDRTVLMTDAVSLAGMPDGESPRTDGRSVDKSGMTIKIKGTDTLAGSALDMNMALKNAAKNSNLDLPQLSLIASQNAARLMGVADRYGSLEPGKCADIAILDSSLNVTGVLLDGRWRSGSFAK
jgi:N-acetylglucosamine-6-phosphate deacetylase